MKSRIPLYLAGIAVVAACSSKTLYQEIGAVAPEILPDSMYTCVGKQLDSLGFKRNRYDMDTKFISARRTATAARESNALARKWFDQIDVTVTPDNTGATTMLVRASSFMETNTQRGPTTTETRAYPAALAAADSLIAACGGSRRQAS